MLAVFRSWFTPAANGGNSALYDHLMDRNLRASQVGMLIIAVGALCAANWAMRDGLAVSMRALMFYMVMRWAVGEFLWCWLAADHVFSTVADAHRKEQWRDWQLANLSPGEIVHSVQQSTLGFLMLGIGIVLLADAVLPLHLPTGILLQFANAPASWFGMLAVYPAILAASHASTARLATAICLEQALRSPASPAGWPVAMLRLAFLLVQFNGIPLIVFLLFAPLGTNETHALGAGAVLVALSLLAIRLKEYAASRALAAATKAAESEELFEPRKK